MRRRAGGSGGARRARALGRMREVARRLKERAAPRRFWCEEYGPEGEIEEVTEWRAPGGGIEFYVVTCTDYAPPKTDWRERGVVPRRGALSADRP